MDRPLLATDPPRVWGSYGAGGCSDPWGSWAFWGFWDPWVFWGSWDSLLLIWKLNPVVRCRLREWDLYCVRT